MKVTDNEDQMWEMFDAWVKDEMIGTKGELKRGWKEYSMMDLHS